MPQRILSYDSLAVLIDCWSRIKSQALTEIVDQCVNNPTIKTVVLSTYIPKIEPFFSPVERQWYPRTKKIFFDNMPCKSFSDLWLDGNRHNLPKSWTHDCIRNMKPVPGQTRFQAQNSLYLLYYLNIVNPSIKNVYFFGGGWDKCLKWRSTGWKDMAYLIQSGLIRKDINLLTMHKCTYGHFEFYQNQTPVGPWIPVNDQVHRLDVSQVDFDELPEVPTDEVDMFSVPMEQ